MEDYRIYTGSSGLNNKIAPHRLPYSSETGVAALEDTVDVVIDRTGEILTRRGTVSVDSGSFHSLFPTIGGFYCVEDRTTDSALKRAVIQSDGTIALNGIRSGLSHSKRIEYSVLDGDTFYSNGTQEGRLHADSSSPWTVNDERETTKDIRTKPVAEHFDMVAGRFLMSVGDELFATEYGLPGLVDYVENCRRFESRIVMVAGVQTGAYISDEEGVYFLGGTNPKEWSLKKVLNYPAIEWGKNATLVDPSMMGFQTTALSVLFATVQGAVIGYPDGSVYNLINKNIVSPSDCKDGCIMVVDESMVLQS